jgi:hypothetical protein
MTLPVADRSCRLLEQDLQISLVQLELVACYRHGHWFEEWYHSK